MATGDKGIDWGEAFQVDRWFARAGKDFGLTGVDISARVANVKSRDGAISEATGGILDHYEDEQLRAFMTELTAIGIVLREAQEDTEDAVFDHLFDDGDDY